MERTLVDLLHAFHSEAIVSGHTFVRQKVYRFSKEQQKKKNSNCEENNERTATNKKKE